MSDPLRPRNSLPNAVGGEPRIRRRGVCHAVVGALLLIVAVVGLCRDVSWLAQPFYCWVWWGYILLLDGFSAWKRGDSILTTRRRFVVPICIWSITFWFFFELLNARIQNWYYVEVFPSDALLAGSLFAVFAFSTVFMGIFQTVDALNASGLWRRWKGPSRRFPGSMTYAIQGVGLLMAGVALIFPYYLGPLIWGSITLLVDPWNYRRGARSLLRDLEHGDYGLLARILLGGLICGVVWESLNFYAPQKWLYTVRGLEGFKVFEMPLIGFLGFPALALDSLAAFALLSSWFLGNQSWERPGDLSWALEVRRPRGSRVFWGAAGLQVFFWIVVSVLATSYNVGSIQIELRDLGAVPAEMRQLQEIGILRPRQLLLATAQGEARARLCRQLQWREDRLEELRRRAALYTFKGIGLDYGRLLEAVGIHVPNDLSHWEPEALHARLSAQVWTGPLPPPRLDFVKVWILAARHWQDRPN